MLTTILAAAVIALAGCSPEADPLDDTSWKLVGWTLSSLDPGDFTITAAFARGQVGGTSGVNSYSGPCAAGGDGSFSAGPFQGTLMAGPEPAMRAENAYLTLLGDARSFAVNDGTLTLYDQGGNQSLIFQAAPGG